MVCALGLSAVVPPDAGAAVVLCKRKKKILLREDACRGNEQVLTLSGSALDAAGVPKVGSATRADSAARADSATQADSAAQADNATRAATATLADTATVAAFATQAGSAVDAQAFGGLGVESYQRRVRWAHVAADGSIVAQSGGISVKSALTDGLKILDFGEVLLGRGVIATLKGGTTANGLIRVTICGGNPPETTPCNVMGADDITSELGVATLNADLPALLENKSFYVAVLP